MDDLKRVWNQSKIPVVLRRTGRGARLRVRLPYSAANRAWLQDERRTNPVWVKNGEYWELPKA